jgi:hypothetical protein
VRRSVLIQATVLAVTICDLLHFQLRQNPTIDAGKWTKPPATVEILKRDPSIFRMYCLGGRHAHRRIVDQAGGWEGDLQPFVEQREFIQASTNVLHGLSSPDGYANLLPRYIVDVWGDQNRAGVITHTAEIRNDTFFPLPAFWKLMRMYNVKYLTSFWPFASSANLKPLGLYGGAYLYQNDDFLPRAYLVRGVVPVADGKPALNMIFSDAFDPGRSVMLEAVPPNYQPSEGSGGNVEILSYTTNQAEMKVETAQQAILVFSDSYYPGWSAEVDGRETTIYRANITQRAVVVPAGDHQVKFRFKAPTVVVGFWISMGALLVFLACFLFPFLRARKTASQVEAAG